MLDALTAFERYVFIPFGLITIIFLLRSISLFRNEARPGFMWGYSPYGNLLITLGFSIGSFLAIREYYYSDRPDDLSFSLAMAAIVFIGVGLGKEARKKEAFKKPWLAND